MVGERIHPIDTALGGATPNLLLASNREGGRGCGRGFGGQLSASDLGTLWL